jgi:hypothetical protein
MLIYRGKLYGIYLPPLDALWAGYNLGKYEAKLRGEV